MIAPELETDVTKDLRETKEVIMKSTVGEIDSVENHLKSALQDGFTHFTIQGYPDVKADIKIALKGIKRYPALRTKDNQIIRCDTGFVWTFYSKGIK